MAVTPFGQLAGQLEADDLRNQHGRRLTEHGGFRLNAAHAPAEHTDAVDHGGVRVGAEHGIRIGPALAVLVRGKHHAGEVLQVHLMHDTCARRHDLEVVERFLAPAQERVTLLIALELDFDVLLQRGRRTVGIHLHGVIDHQLGRRQWVDLVGVAAQLDHRIAHGGQIDHARHAGEILQHDAGGHEGDFDVGLGLGIPLRDRLDLFRGDVEAVFVTQQVFQQDLHRVRQSLQVETLSQLGQAGEDMLLAIDVESVAYGKGVFHG